MDTRNAIQKHAAKVAGPSKVWGFRWPNDSRRVIVKARNMGEVIAAMDALGYEGFISKYHLSNYGSVTNNAAEVAAAEAAGDGVPLISQDGGHEKNYQPLPPRKRH